MDWFVIWFFFKKFLVGFGIALAIRFMIALLLKSDCSLQGFINTGIVGGLIWMSLWIYHIITL